MGTEHREVVIVGGGQAGLATAFELGRRGVDRLVLDAQARIGDRWRGRWDSLRLFTPARVDCLPGSRFPASDMTFPTKDEMADYLESYADEMRIPVRCGTRVLALDRADGSYLVETTGGSYMTPHVVIATGYDSPKVPDFASQLSPAIKQLHVIDYRNPGQLAGDVLVVGAGTSGVEVAVDAVHAGHRTVLAGRGTGEIPPAAYVFGGRIFYFYARHILSVRTPMGRRVRDWARSHGTPLIRLKLADAVRAGVVRMPRVRGTVDGRPAFADGSTASPDTIVWCTGFRHEYDWIKFPIAMEHGMPRQCNGVVDGEPGLYVVGQPFQTSLASVFILGVGADARRVATTIAGRLAWRSAEAIAVA